MTSPQLISSQAWADGPVSSVPIPAQFVCSDGDRLVWMMRGYGDMQIHCTVHLRGRIQPERLARAIRLSLNVEPVLGCYYRERWWRSTWHRHTNLDELPLCTVEHTEDLDTSLQAFLTEEFNPAHDPLIHARVLRQEHHDTLCVKVSHVIADAGGTKQYMYLLASLYNQLADTPKLQVEPRLSASRSTWQVVRQLGWSQLGQSIKRSVIDLYHRLFPLRYWRVPTQDGPSTQRTFVFQHIQPEQYQEITQFARQHQATLNDVITAAYLRALDKVFDIPEKHPMRAMNTVDLRRYLPGRQLERICNLSNFSHPHFSRIKDEDFVQTVSKFRDHMNLLKANMLGTGDLAALSLLFNILPAAWCNHLGNFIFRYLNFLMSPVLTNMGPIDTYQLNFDDCPIDNAYLTASVIYPPLFGGGFSGFGENITLSFGFCETGIAAQTVSDLLTQTVRELPS